MPSDLAKSFARDIASLVLIGGNPSPEFIAARNRRLERARLDKEAVFTDTHPNIVRSVN